MFPYLFIFFFAFSLLSLSSSSWSSGAAYTFARYGACTDDHIAEEPRLASTSPRRAACSRPSSSWSPASAREQHRARQSGRRAVWADGERSLCDGLGAWSARTASAWADGQRSRDGACARPARMGAQPGRSRGLRGRQARPARTASTAWARTHGCTAWAEARRARRRCGLGKLRAKPAVPSPAPLGRNRPAPNSWFL